MPSTTVSSAGSARLPFKFANNTSYTLAGVASYGSSSYSGIKGSGTASSSTSEKHLMLDSHSHSFGSGSYLRPTSRACLWIIKY